MATLSALLSAEEATACMESVRAGCRSTDGSRDANQADTFVELLTGITPAQPVPVTVIMTDQGAEIEGYGPISDGHAAALAGPPEHHPRCPSGWTARPWASATPPVLRCGGMCR